MRRLRSTTPRVVGGPAIRERPHRRRALPATRAMSRSFILLPSRVVVPIPCVPPSVHGPSELNRSGLREDRLIPVGARTRPRSRTESQTRGNRSPSARLSPQHAPKCLLTALHRVLAVFRVSIVYWSCGPYASRPHNRQSHNWADSPQRSAPVVPRCCRLPSTASPVRK